MAKEVTLLTGFLGAGKTTLLNAVIAGKKDTRFAIIENEIGEESIDAGLIVKAEDGIIELNNGCLCCSLNEDLFEILNNLWLKRAQWDHLLIEATGIADPANIAHPFLTSDAVKKGYTLKRVICVVDAELIEDQLKDHVEAIQQIAFSDVILLNKTAQLDPAYVQGLKEILKTMNPFADILQAVGQDFPVAAMFRKDRLPGFPAQSKAITSKGIFSLGESTAGKQPLLAAATAHHRHVHSDIETMLLKYAVPMDIEALEHRMTVFLVFQSLHVYRIKAFIYSEGFSSRIILQTVGKSLSITLGEAWMPDEVRESRIVVIGRQLKLQGMDQVFRSCLAAGHAAM